LDVKQSLPECAELGQRRYRAREHDAVAGEWRVLDVNPGRFEHRLELFAYDVIGPRDDRRFAVIRLEQSARVVDAEPFAPACNQPARVRFLERECVDWISGAWYHELVTLAIEAAKHRVCQLARADAVASL